MKRIYRYLIATFALLINLRIVQAQNLLIANAADRGDARAGLLNPAIAVLQHPLFTLGSKALHTGVTAGNLDLRNSYFSVTTSNRRLLKFDQFGYGLQGQVLQTPLFNTVALNAVFGKSFSEKFAAGVNVGFMNRAFDRSQFQLEVEDDPALAQLSKWVFPDVGFGVVAVPTPYVTLAFSVEHLTRPNVAMQGGAARLDHSFNLGAAFGMGNFRALIGVARDEKEILPTLAFESFRSDLGFVKIGFGRDAATLEGSVYVMQGVSMSYRYNHPMNDLRLASNGSHEIGLTFNFRKNRALYEPEWLSIEYKNRRLWAINPATAFTVKSAIDTLKIVDKYINRKVDSLFAQKDLAGLPVDIFFSGDSLDPVLPSFNARPLPEAKIADRQMAPHFEIPPDSIGIVRAMQKDHTNNYLEFLRHLKERMRDPEFRASIVASSDGKRLALLKAFLQLYGVPEDRLTIISSDALQPVDRGKLGSRRIPGYVFHREIMVPADTFLFDFDYAHKKLRDGPAAWSLILEDSDGKTLYKLSGQNQIPRRKVWDWRLPEGQLPQPGKYFYYIHWKSTDGQAYTSPRQPLVVTRENRRIAIEILRPTQIQKD